MTIKTCYADEYQELCKVFKHRGIPFNVAQVDEEYHITPNAPYGVIREIMKDKNYW